MKRVPGFKLKLEYQPTKLAGRICVKQLSENSNGRPGRVTGHIILIGLILRPTTSSMAGATNLDHSFGLESLLVLSYKPEDLQPVLLMV